MLRADKQTGTSPGFVALWGQEGDGAAACLSKRHVIRGDLLDEPTGSNTSFEDRSSKTPRGE